jgi:hypothetical protein
MASELLGLLHAALKEKIVLVELHKATKKSRKKCAN